MAKRIVFTGKQQVELQSWQPPEVSAGKVRLKTLRSLMSTGTETICFNRLFDADTAWHGWVKYPFYPGYSCIGEIVEAGPSVTTLKPGDVVACRGGHSSEHVMNAEACHLVPRVMAPEAAAWFAMAKIAAMGARAAQHRLGESVLIIGAGPVGQMAVRWANLMGPETLMVADMVVMRLDLARRGGATHTFAVPVEEATEQIKTANRGELPDLVIDTTGSAKVFASALRAVRKFGRVLLLGDTGTPDQQHLTHDVIGRGLHIVGAHDTHEDADWNTARILRLFFRFTSAGRFDLQGLNTHEFAPEKCVEAYRFATDRRAESMGIVFKW